MKNPLFIIVILLLLMFMAPTLFSMAKSDLSTPTEEWVEACQWLKENTPDDSLIIAWWDYGYWIKYMAERKTFADPGQNAALVHELSIGFLSYSVPEWPLGTKYLVLDNATVNEFQRSMATWAGLDYLSVNHYKTLVGRLYSGESINGYILVKDGEIKVWEVR